MNPQVPQGFPQYGSGIPHPPKRGLATGWIITIVAIGMVVVLGVAVGAFALLYNSGSSSYNKPDGKYGATPLPGCDEVASRAGNLPPKSSDKELEGNQGWLCSLTNSVEALSVHLDLEVNTVQRQRTRFDNGTSSGAYVLDPTVRLGEKAAWGLAPSGHNCYLIVLDSNAMFKVSISDWKVARDDTQTCKNKARDIAQVLYNVIQPR